MESARLLLVYYITLQFDFTIYACDEVRESKRTTLFRQKKNERNNRSGLGWSNKFLCWTNSQVESASFVESAQCLLPRAWSNLCLRCPDSCVLYCEFIRAHFFFRLSRGLSCVVVARSANIRYIAVEERISLCTHILLLSVGNQR